MTETQQPKDARRLASDGFNVLRLLQILGTASLDRDRRAALNPLAGGPVLSVLAMERGTPEERAEGSAIRREMEQVLELAAQLDSAALGDAVDRTQSHKVKDRGEMSPEVRAVLGTLAEVYGVDPSALYLAPDDVPCPSCKAGAGEPCVTHQEGKPVDYFHARRLDEVSNPSGVPRF